MQSALVLVMGGSLGHLLQHAGSPHRLTQVVMFSRLNEQSEEYKCQGQSEEIKKLQTFISIISRSKSNEHF